MMNSRLLLALVFLLAPWRAYADWPQFKRDASRSGNAIDDALSLPLQRILAIRFPSPIYASPAVVKGKLYVQDARGNLACLNVETNRSVWTTNIGGVANLSSPAVAGGKVFVGSSAGYLAIVDAATGKLLKKVPGKGGVITAPAVAGKSVYFSTLAGKLVKLDLEGKHGWTFSGGPSSHIEIAVRDGEILFFATGADEKPSRWESAILYRLKDEGDRVSVVSKSYSNHYPTGGPVFGPGSQCGYQRWGGEQGGFVIYRWNKDPKGTYHFHRGDLTDARITPSVRGDQYFMADRTGLICAEPQSDGKNKVLWHSGGWPYYGPNGFHSSPALSKNAVVAGCDDGKVYFFPITHSGKDRNRIQKPAWIFATEGAGKVNGAVTSSPAISQGKVFFGGEDGILYGLGKGEPIQVIDLVTRKQTTTLVKRPGNSAWRTAGGDLGFSAVSPDKHLKPPLQIRWRTRIWGSFKGTMIVADGKVFAASRSGTLTALDADTGAIIWKTRNANTNSWSTSTFADGKLLVFRGNSAGPKDKLGGGIWCHDALTGHLLWQKQKPVPTGVYDFSAGLVNHDGNVLACWLGDGGAMQAAAYRIADGKPVWTRQYPGILPKAGKGQIHVSQGCLGGKTWFCSVSRTGRNGKADKSQGQGGATLAIDPASGNLIWKQPGYYVGKESRVSYRKGTIVVFDGWPSQAHGLDPRNGKHLWTAKIASTQLNPLTDLFLSSKGSKGISGGSFCGYHVYANGHFYGTHGYSQARIVAKQVDDQGRLKIVWSHPTMSRSCPAPAPAYGRLYYAANGEGVVYCFENARQ